MTRFSTACARSAGLARCYGCSVIGCCGEVRQLVKGFVRGGPGGGGVRNYCLAGTGRDLEDVVLEGEVPSERVAEQLGPAAVVADVMAVQAAGGPLPWSS